MAGPGARTNPCPGAGSVGVFADDDLPVPFRDEFRGLGQGVFVGGAGGADMALFGVRAFDGQFNFHGSKFA